MVLCCPSGGSGLPVGRPHQFYFGPPRTARTKSLSFFWRSSTIPKRKFTSHAADGKLTEVVDD